jgi:hypothetical protein
MIIRLTLLGLTILLIVVIALSYYVNKEGFEDITATKEKILSGVTEEPRAPVPTPSPASPADSSTPKRNVVVPEISLSGSAYDAMNLQERMDLLKDIQKVVRNEIIAHRNTKPIIPGETRQDDTNSTAQGKEYESSCHKDTEYRCPKNPDGSCPPVPDMTQYIKKDAIPCWGCTLDY